MADTNYLKLLTKDFFNRHPVKKFSAARLLYSALLMPQVFDAVEKFLPELNALGAGEGFAVPDHAQLIDRIKREEDVSQLLRMIRQSMPPHVKNHLISRLLERKDEALPEIQRLILRTFSSHAIENCVTFMTKCKTDCSNWIIEHYQDVREPYARSMLCLVLGFRSTPEAIPFLIQQMEFFEKRFPDESFDQAPLMALYEIRARFRTL